MMRFWPITAKPMRPKSALYEVDHISRGIGFRKDGLRQICFKTEELICPVIPSAGGNRDLTALGVLL